MIALVDTHVHFYSCYDIERGLEAAWKNFENFAPASDGNVCRALYLTERSDCFVFRTLRDNSATLVSPEKFSFSSCADAEVLKVERHAGGEMYLVAGRQISTAERLEVLALHTLSEFRDGLGIDESIEHARASGARLVLNWSLGKWMFSRGRKIERILRGAGADDFLLGDVPARPLGWGMPRLIRLGVERGMLTVAGSDPLPFPGEEVGIGSYVSKIESTRADATITGFFRDIIGDRFSERKITGARNTPWLAGIRLWRNSRSKSRKGGTFPPCCV